MMAQRGELLPGKAAIQQTTPLALGEIILERFTENTVCRKECKIISEYLGSADLLISELISNIAGKTFYINHQITVK